MTKPSPYPKKWTLLFLGSHGRTLHFHHLKAVLALIGAGFALTVAAALFFYFQYQHHTQRLRTVEASLASARKETQRLKKEKQALTLQLALKHASVPAAVEPTVKKTQKTAARTTEKKGVAEVVQKDTKTVVKQVIKEADTPSSKASPEVSSPEPDTATVSKPDEPSQMDDEKPDAHKPEETEIGRSRVAEAEARQPAVVDVANFQLSKDNAHNRWVIRFTIKRTATATGKINGRAFIVLKDDSDDYGNWVCVPPAALIKGKPAPEQRGYTFAINNFLNARVSMKQQTPPENVQEAVVYVYAEKGPLLLEKAFPIEN